ncbi:hypothetical protein [Caulobacter sp. Root655]|uniref:hypothetical protein n=1 Tax=Caulobacter sp. Root655 TaxID=1736578 RepID=UPI000AD44F9F|nr:hypothetical protein [Caulobacter sp. Root655]
MDRESDPFLGEEVGRKPVDFSGASSGIDVGINALAEAAPIPIAVIGGVIAGVGLLTLLAWKSFAGLGGRKTSR